ncbi:MAG TPA: methyltransferase domain-containing protein [Oscillospiraceae bacterium]|nr:methyltransferase domain-containing protein [Oscillospiraceae bacterium]
MATWNELFLNDEFIAALPQPEVYKFVKVLERKFPDKPLSIWDFCCGAGRHTVLLSQMGHKAYGSDISENGIIRAQKWLDNNRLKATLKVADMTEKAFAGTTFHGVFSWDALHHNTIGNINKAVENVYESLYDGGMFMASLISTKSGSSSHGKEIERNTYVNEEGSEAGVPHHYFDEQGIRDLFNKWRIISLVEIEATYIEADIDFSINPFPYTKWNVIVQK